MTATSVTSASASRPVVCVSSTSTSSRSRRYAHRGSGGVWSFLSHLSHSIESAGLLHSQHSPVLAGSTSRHQSRNERYPSTSMPTEKRAKTTKPKPIQGNAMTRASPRSRANEPDRPEANKAANTALTARLTTDQQNDSTDLFTVSLGRRRKAPLARHDRPTIRHRRWTLSHHDLRAARRVRLATSQEPLVYLHSAAPGKLSPGRAISRPLSRQS